MALNWMPELTGNAQRTFRFHLAYALLDATAGGILMNAPIVAIKAFEAANWHLPLREFYAAVGMLATLYLASRMATRPKMPYVFLPGILAGVTTLTMALATGSAFWFLTLLGVGAMFEVLTRPAVTAILRLNYPVEHRGHATGRIRGWSSLAFVVSSVASALLLRWASESAEAAGGGTSVMSGWLAAWSAEHMAQLLMVSGDVQPRQLFVLPADPSGRAFPGETPRQRVRIGQGIRDALSLILVRNGRFRRYLFSCFLDGFCQSLYLPLIWIFLSRDLGYGYLGSCRSDARDPRVGRIRRHGHAREMFDRVCPWISWAGVRFAWGIDAMLLAATPFYVAPVSAGRRGHAGGRPSAERQRTRRLVDPVLASRRHVFRAARRGHKPVHGRHGLRQRSDPSARLADQHAADGLRRASRSVCWLSAASGVILSGVYSFWQTIGAPRRHEPQTIAEFEHQFGIDR
jgi:hypothetical protein